MRPTCYLHVGTHKTGTTSLQVFLTSNEARLTRAGLYVPRAGRPWPPLSGHHNVAWELSADPRFDPRHGTLADVVGEIAAARAPVACLSSEDFEYLHDEPPRLRSLSDALGSIGYDAKAIVYVRPQADYAESLYPTLVQHGLAVGFPEFLGTVLRDGVFRMWRWIFRFEYSVLLDVLAGAFGPDNVIVRSYRSGRGSDALLRDFLTIVSEGTRGLRFEALAPVQRLNARADDGRRGPVALVESLRIIGRFWRDNRRVRARYGVRLPCVERSDLWRDVVATLRVRTRTAAVARVREADDGRSR